MASGFRWSILIVSTLSTLFWGKLPLPAADFPPRTVSWPAQPRTLAEAIALVEKQTGIVIDLSRAETTATVQRGVDQRTFWQTLEQLAEETKHRVTISDSGRKIALVPQSAQPAITFSSVHGPFRFVVREIFARRDFDTGRGQTVVVVDLHWEPLFPVFRIDGPTLRKVKDDRGDTPTVATSGAKIAVSGTQVTTSIRLEQIPRQAQTLAEIEGEWRITASTQWLRFRLADLGEANPMPQMEKNVTFRLLKLARTGAYWDIDIELVYPPGGPEFESFESYLNDNRIALVAPGGGVRIAPSATQQILQGERSRMRYRFRDDKKTTPLPQNLKGWSLEYETPTPPLEVRVPFRFEKLLLP